MSSWVSHLRCRSHCCSGTKVFLRAAASPDSKSQDNSGVPRACGGSMVNDSRLLFAELSFASVFV